VDVVEESNKLSLQLTKR